ncbi:hypothetical protein SLS60_006302 [Paraconiothyrium brasiliense]|uniref:Uncharacterized protein n=1 Tax=Paraconiothyrium brasiliense TaxID=300254 RepID=A0ABR3RAB7_9PLEO
MSKRKAASLPETPQGRPPTMATEGAADNDFITATSNQESTSSGSLHNSSPGFEVPDFTTPINVNMLLSDSEYMDMMRPLEQHSFDFAASTSETPWDDTLELEGFGLNTGDPACLAEESSLAKTEESCTCLARAVGTHEAIEVASWGQRKLSSDADNMLQHQKKLLLECEGLLECENCSTLPAYVMLLISMCSRLLETLEDMCRDDLTVGSKEAVRVTKAGQFLEDRKNKDGRESSKWDKSRRRYIVNIWSRQLDDDDERLVLQSLLTARFSRLDRLLGTLDQVVSQHSWPAHKALLREMQHRLARAGPLA